MSKVSEIEAMIDAIQKKYGSESLMLLRGHKIEAIPVLRTGSLGLDIALGVGGYPRGRIVEIYGPESSGKTTLALHAIAEVQKEGGLAGFVDAEHALDLGYAEALGVRSGELLLSQPDFGEQALNIVEDLVDSGKMDLIVIDSVAALTPKVEIDGEMGQAHLGVHSRLMSQALRKLVATASNNNVTLIFINQLRQKIGVMFGSPEVTTGGNALKFYASVRIDVRRREQVKEGDAAVGNQTLVKVVKNKVAPPFRDCTLEIIWGKGIDRAGDVLACAVHCKVVDKSGAWFSFEERRLGQGFNNAAHAIAADEALFMKLEQLVREKELP